MSVHADYTDDATRNAYGHKHTSAAARIDGLLINGATGAVLEQERVSWREHLRHLREVHGVNVVVTAQGVYIIG
jgi:hypothetical protein